VLAVKALAAWGRVESHRMAQAKDGPLDAGGKMYPSSQKDPQFGRSRQKSVNDTIPSCGYDYIQVESVLSASGDETRMRAVARRRFVYGRGPRNKGDEERLALLVESVARVFG
jgi:hypothetical protein